GEWYSRDSDFAVDLGYRAAQPVQPAPGGVANAGRPFAWRAVPLASGYRLRIAARPHGDALFDSGILDVTSVFVSGLPSGRRLHATLTTTYVESSVDSSFEFQTEASSTASGPVLAAFAATVEVRAMSGPGAAWPRTLLDKVVKQQRAPGVSCVEFALALV